MTAPVYLILSPALRRSYRWMKWRRELALLLPDTQLVCWDGLPRGFLEVPGPDRPDRIARAFSAAVVIPEKHGTRTMPRRLGRTAAAEAGAFRTAGKPVHLYAAGILVPWADCQIREAGSGPEHVPLEVIIPAPPPYAWGPGPTRTKEAK